jgi:AcrR family transcriptional regulator
MAISEVAAQAGLSQSGLLHHFPSKVALLTAVLDKREREDSEFLFGDGTTPLGWAAFESLIALAARNTTRPDWVRVFVRVAAEATEVDHPARDWVLKHYSSTRRWLSEAIEFGVTAGEMKAGIPLAAVVNNTIAVLDGVQEQWVVDAESVSMVDCVSEHVRQLKESWAA